jgi:PAS domain S-box-containing protein
MPYLTLLGMVAAILTILALVIWLRQRAPEAKTAALLLLAGAEWLLGYGLHLSSEALPTKILWNKVQYLGMVTLPVAWLIYTLQYTGHEKWVTRRLVALLSVVPLIMLLLVFTNEAHGLIWQYIALDTSGLFPTLVSVRGPGSWAFAAYAYILLLLGCLLLVRMLFRSPRPYSWRGGVLLISVFIPWLASALPLFGVNPFPNPNLVPVIFAASSLAMAYSLFRLRRRDIVSVAHGTIFHSISEGVMVLDAQDRIVDLNPAAQHLIGHTGSEAVGKPVQLVWPEWYGQIGRPCNSKETGREVTLIREDGQRTYSVSSSPVLDWRGRLISEVIVLHDVTERKQAEAERERLIRELQDALIRVKKLSGLLPICASCKKIRDDKGYWNQLEAYIQDHSEAEFSHGICPDCAKRLYPQFFGEDSDEEASS